MEKSIKLLKLIFTPLAFGFFIYFAWSSRNLLVTVFTNAKYHYLILSILILMLNHFVISIATFFILKTVNATIPYWLVFKIHVARLPARYIPGGIWHTVGRMMDFHSHGIKPAQLTGFFLLENIIAAGMAFLLGGIFLWYFRDLSDFWGEIAKIAFICSIIGLILTPRILNYKVKIIKKNYLLTIVTFIPLWFFLTSAFIMYLSAFSFVLEQSSSVEIGGIFMFSWGVGFLAIFAPQGIGIFEVVAGNMLNAPLSLGSIAVLLAGFRVITVISDICLWSCLRISNISKLIPNNQKN